MGKTTDQIASEIRESRDDLRSNLQELETRVMSVTDWRGYARKHPGAVVAAALAGGALLSTLIGKSRKDH
jgi:hypothetical protein